MKTTLIVLFLVCLLTACSRQPQPAELNPAILSDPTPLESLGAAQTITPTIFSTPAPDTAAHAPDEAEVIGQLALGKTTKPEEIAEIARQHLAGQLQIPVDGVSVTGIDAAEWPDLTLGCGKSADHRQVRQSPLPVPGFRFVLAASDSSYEYHSGGGWLVFCGKAKAAFDEGILIPTGTYGSP
jgi:hypothetical protein